MKMLFTVSSWALARRRYPVGSRCRKSAERQAKRSLGGGVLNAGEADAMRGASTESRSGSKCSLAQGQRSICRNLRRDPPGRNHMYGRKVMIIAMVA